MFMFVFENLFKYNTFKKHHTVHSEIKNCQKKIITQNCYLVNDNICEMFY